MIIEEPVRTAENRLLEALAPEDALAIARHLRRVELSHGEVLFEPGDDVRHVHFPSSGAVSMVMLLRDGAAVETTMVGREGVTCPSAYLEATRASVRGVVQLPGDARRIEASVLRDLAAERPALRAVLEGYAARLFRELEQACACNATHRLVGRLAKWLLRSHDRADGDMLPLTQEYLAFMLGSQRTTVTEVARMLQMSGAIAYRRGRITILNRAVLEQLSCECYAMGAPPA